MNKSLSNALEEQTVIAKVVDLDYHRNYAAFGSVDTHYIIEVHPSTSSTKHSRFGTFRIEKTFKDFRTLVTEFKRASNETTDDLKDKGQSGWKDVPESTQTFIAFSDAFAHVIDSSPKTYIAKMSFDHVEKLSTARRDILEKALRVMLENYPDKSSSSTTTSSTPMSPSTPSSPLSSPSSSPKSLPVILFKKIVSDFFLTDHIYDEDSDSSDEIENNANHLGNSSGHVNGHANTATTSRSISSYATQIGSNTNAQINTDNSDATSTTRTHHHQTNNSNNGYQYDQQQHQHQQSQSNQDGIINNNEKKEITTFDDFDYGLVIKSSLDNNDDYLSTTPIHSPTKSSTTIHLGQQQQGKLQTQQNNDDHMIRPKSHKKRLSHKTRIENEHIFMRSKALHMYDDDDHHAIQLAEKRQNETLLDDPKKVIFLLIVTCHFFLLVPDQIISMRLDKFILCLYSLFVCGLHVARPPVMEEEEEDYDDGELILERRQRSTIEHEPSNTRNRRRADSAGISRRVLGGDKGGESRKNKSKSVGFTLRETLFSDSADNAINGVLKPFPLGASLGSVFNCWSPSTYADFLIRGQNYLKDKIKIPSRDFIFPPRGVEVFLTDCCPAHIGRYKVMMNQALREKPSFIVNFRLPWGNCVFTSEIPAKFLPFLTHRYNPSSSSESPPSMAGMSPQEICTCRFLMGDDNHKRQTLKILPAVVKGPWIVKKVVDGKPAIVGSKIPTEYIYEPANPEKGLAEYLEMDLDIVASSAARGILAVAQRYTKTLTLDLGFVIQGNRTDELPEQMLIGMRLHGLDPLTAPDLPEDTNTVH